MVGVDGEHLHYPSIWGASLLLFLSLVCRGGEGKREISEDASGSIGLLGSSRQRRIITTLAGILLWSLACFQRWKKMELLLEMSPLPNKRCNLPVWWP
jgi:hypothetical protein